MGTGSGSFGVATSISGANMSVGTGFVDLNGDGKLDLVSMNNTDSTVGIHFGNGDGTFRARISYNAGPTHTSTWHAVTGDMNNDGVADLIINNRNFGWSMLLGNADGSFNARIAMSSDPVLSIAETADLNGDGNLDLVYTNVANGVQVALGNGNGTFKAAVSLSVTGTSTNLHRLHDFNGDGVLDIFAFGGGNTSLYFGNGDGTFKAPLSTAIAHNTNIHFADFNRDGGLDMLGASFSPTSAVILKIGITQGVTTIGRLDLLSASSARNSMAVIDATLKRISSELGAIGSTQSRLSVAASNVMVARENFESAASRIMDADMASESSELVRTRILQQAASAVLAQANQRPALAIRLLT